MKRIILTAAALTLAGPALAASQLEMLHGVSPNVYTTAQLAEIHLSADNQTGVKKHYETKGVLVLSTTGSQTAGVTPFARPMKGGS